MVLVGGHEVGLVLLHHRSLQGFHFVQQILQVVVGRLDIVAPDVVARQPQVHHQVVKADLLLSLARALDRKGRGGVRVKA